MKNTFFLILLLSQSIVNSQVSDISRSFKKTGYVQSIDYDQKLIQVNFITTDKNISEQDEILKSQVFSIDGCQLISDKKDKIEVTDLRSSDQVVIEGEFFEVENKSEIKKITLSSKKANGIEKGRIDIIKNDFAYIDGKKVKLGKGEKIKGKSDSGYNKKIFNSISELKEGDFADVRGKYSKEGYFMATDFVIEPEMETSFDKAAMEFDIETYESLYPKWIDPDKRKSLFGKAIPGLGKITSNQAVQEYVNRVGQKLIPAHITQRKKINFIFIVVDNPDLLAYVRANGLAFICTGLLYNLENEAQLATVLGHEISHAIYEHQADEDRSKVKKEENTKKTELLLKKGLTAINVTTDVKQGLKDAKSKKTKSEGEKESELDRKKQRNENQDALNKNITTTTSAYLDKKISDYSIEDEYQADRVGLCLMVMAGYDPREAPIVWKNIYEKYGKITNDNDKAAITKKYMAALEKDNLENKNKTYDTKGLATQTAQSLMLFKQIEYKTKSVKTHPNELKRFEELNKLIALYWNNPELLENTISNEDEYREMLTKLIRTKNVPVKENTTTDQKPKRKK